MSADLDALDRGVIEAGGDLAEAIAWIAALETKVSVLEARIQALFRCISRRPTGMPAWPTQHLRGCRLARRA